MTSIMTKTFTTLVAILALGGGPARAETTILTLKDCLDMASAHPDLLSAKGELEAATARVSKAASSWRTTVSLSDQYSRYEDGEDGHSGSMGLTQRIFDSGQTGLSVKASREEQLSVEADRRSAIQTVRYTITEAYCDLLDAEEAISIAREIVDQNVKHLEIASGFYDVGEKSLIDVTQAKVNLSQAQLELVKATHAEELARQELGHAMGRPETGTFEIADLAAEPRPTDSLTEAISTAMANHPDLESYRHSVTRAETSVKAAAKGLSPTVNATAGFSWNGKSIMEDGEWSVAIKGTIPISDGGLTKAETEEAKADLEIARAKSLRTAQNVELAVRKAWLELDEAEQSLEVAKKILEQSKANLELANGRYEVGEGSPSEVADAVTDYGEARRSLSSARYDREKAVAALKQAMGGL